MLANDELQIDVQVLTRLEERIDLEVFEHLVEAIRSEALRASRNALVQSPVPLQIDMAVFPDGERLVGVRSESMDHWPGLEQAVKTMPLPAVAELIAFVSLVHLVSEPDEIELGTPFVEHVADWGEEPEPALYHAIGRTWPVHADQPAANVAVPLLGSLDDALIESCQLLTDTELNTLIDEERLAEPILVRAGRYEAAGEWQRAAAEYARVFELQPDAIGALAHRAECFLQGNQTQPCLEEFSRVVALRPELPIGYFGRGVVYMVLEAWTAAREQFSQAIQCDPLVPQAYIWRAKSYLGEIDLPSALTDINAALRLDPYNMDALEMRIRLRPLATEYEETPVDIEAYLDDLDHAVRFGPPHPDLLTRLADRRLAAGEIAEAIQLCEQALAVSDDFHAAYGVRGLAHHAAGELDLAMLDLTRAIDSGDQPASVFCCRAEIFLARSEWESALFDAECAIAADDEYAGAYVQRGVARLEMDQLEAAEKDFLAAMEISPQWAVPYLHLGELAASQDEAATARDYFSQAIALDDDFAVAWMLRGQSFLEDGLREEALSDLNQALKLDPQQVEALNARVSIWLSQDRIDLAVEDLSNILRIQPDAAAALFQRAHCWLKLREFDNARRDFDEVIELCPSLGAAYSGRGYAWIQTGEKEKAAADFHEAILCDPAEAEQIELHRLLAEAAYFHRQERYQDAIDCASQAIQQDPANRPALAMRACSRWYDEEYVDAIDDYTAIIELHGSFSARASRGQVHVEMGDFAAALDDLNMAIELGGENETRTNLAYALSGRALAYAGLERFEEAKADFLQSIRDCPENAWVHYNHGRVYDKLGEPAKAAYCFDLALVLDQPALPPRKRERARAYVERYGVSAKPE